MAATTLSQSALQGPRLEQVVAADLVVQATTDLVVPGPTGLRAWVERMTLLVVPGELVEPKARMVRPAVLQLVVRRVLNPELAAVAAVALGAKS